MSKQISWDTVPDIFKSADKNTFDKDKLEEHLPAQPADEKQREELWNVLDNNGNGSVSLAEFDGWFNQHFGAAESAAGLELANNASKTWIYTKPVLIRAFNLANGVSDAPSKGADNYITKDEFRLLLVATQAGMMIYRLFDIVDTSDDGRVTQDEWDGQLDEINALLHDYGYTGDDIKSSDFSKVDNDGGGMILLNEAVTFFLEMFTHEKALHAENKKEGTGAAPGPKIKPNVGKRQVMSAEEKRRRQMENKMRIEREKQDKLRQAQLKKMNRRSGSGM